jgi:Protein of unknown function DUF262/Protein of unknown function (DUF1524)
MSSLLLATSTPTFGELFTNGRTFVVPRFQRDYKWEQDNWEELWQDLIDVIDTGKEHYMGAIVLKPNDTKKQFDVIDGQQRLATLVLLVLAGVKMFESWSQGLFDQPANQERANLFRDRFLRAKDTASLKETGRLTLNKNDRGFMHSVLMQLKQPVRASTLPPSQKQLWSGFQYFYEKILDRFNSTEDAEGLAELLNTAGDKLLFIQILVSDEMDAYTVFETLNARGTQLSVTDLLKNYLFSQFEGDNNAIDVAEEQWLRISQSELDRDFSRFINYFWNSRYGITRPSRLFKEIRKSINSPQDASKFLDECEQTAGLNAALKEPTDPLWMDINNAKKFINELKIFRATQCYPLLFAAWEVMPHHFAAILKICSVITFRYTVIGGLSTNTMQQHYVAAAIKIRQSAITTPAQLLNALKAIYPSDEQFAADFANISIQTTQKMLVRYILYSIENHLAGNARSFDQDGGTIEHILPENPDEYWLTVFPDAAMSCYRLGNYSLLESTINREISRKPFEEKKLAYIQSAYELSKRITWNEWNISTLIARQQYLSKQAVAIWRLDF